MNPMTSQQVWQQLLREGLVEGEMPAAALPASPWYVRVMMGVAGWIGALFLLAFVGAGFSFVMKSSSASIILGLLCCGAACGIFRAARHNDFATQFGLAISLAGQTLAALGLLQLFNFNSAAAYFLLFLLEAGLAILLPNYIHRVITSWAAMVALSFALERSGLHGFDAALAATGAVLIWMNPQRWAVNGTLWRPIGYGLVLALLQLDLTLVLRAGFLYGGQNAPWISPALLGAIFITLVLRLLAHQNTALSSRIGMASLCSVFLVAALSFATPGLTTAWLVLLLGFAIGNRLLMGLGLLALVAFISHYYYQLHHTLLFKSLVLALTGGTLLLMHWALQRLLPSANEERPHA